MNAFKSKRSAVIDNRSTIDIYAIWDMDAPSAVKSETEILPHFRSMTDIQKTRNFYKDPPMNISLQGDNRSPRLLWRMFNTWIGKLSALLW
jgi:hypothetical protein